MLGWRIWRMIRSSLTSCFRPIALCSRSLKSTPWASLIAHGVPCKWPARTEPKPPLPSIWSSCTSKSSTPTSQCSWRPSRLTFVTSRSVRSVLSKATELLKVLQVRPVTSVLALLCVRLITVRREPDLFDTNLLVGFLPSEGGDSSFSLVSDLIITWEIDLWKMSVMSFVPMGPREGPRSNVGLRPASFLPTVAMSRSDSISCHASHKSNMEISILHFASSTIITVKMADHSKDVCTSPP
mmetsp:Transcript_59217/g.152348  ORF Transcript_59217/g.152348 Transcript_59217/m.152348 type:complete len:240 (-) Transcript_59217:917-1636(-)